VKNLGRKIKETVKKYSCLNCGTPFEVYPPDDLHDIATRNETDFKDHIKINYKCTECNEINTIYWGYDEPVMFVGR